MTSDELDDILISLKEWVINAEHRLNRLEQAGFWGMACARLQTKNTQLQADNAKLRELVKNLRPKYGDVGSRDIDVAATQKLFDEAKLKEKNT